MHAHTIKFKAKATTDFRDGVGVFFSVSCEVCNLLPEDIYVFDVPFVETKVHSYLFFGQISERRQFKYSRGIAIHTDTLFSNGGIVAQSSFLGCALPCCTLGRRSYDFDMQQTLSALVLLGLLLWMFLLYEKTHPMDMLNKIDDANTSERCAQFGYDVEGERTLSYGDRIKQLMKGCW